MSVSVQVEELPLKFPTHRHEPAFWEALGRAVATFGFLEEVLGKAIFALTTTGPVDGDQSAAIAKWHKQLERDLYDPLGQLIGAYETALCLHYLPEGGPFDGLPTDLRAAADLRNIICHGSWEVPDKDGRTVPLFVNKKLEVVQTAMDAAYLDQLQRHAAELCCAVMNSVTFLGWQFPGSNSPGSAVWPSTGHD